MGIKKLCSSFSDLDHIEQIDIRRKLEHLYTNKIGKTISYYHYKQIIDTLQKLRKDLSKLNGKNNLHYLAYGLKMSRTTLLKFIICLYKAELCSFIEYEDSLCAP